MEKRKNEIRFAVDAAGKHTKEFIDLLRYIWLTWLIFFSVTLINTVIDYFSDSLWHDWWLIKDAEELIEVAANSIPCVVFFVCYKKLNDPKIDAKLELRIAFKYIAYYSFLQAGLLLIVRLFYKNISFTEVDTEVNNLFLLISGILNAVFIAALLGRFESKNIRAPKKYIWAMYFYAALQPLVFLTNLTNIHFKTGDGQWIIIVANIRLWLLAVGKVLFYLFMLWILKSKMLSYYFIITPYLIEGGDEFDKHKDELKYIDAL